MEKAWGPPLWMSYYDGLNIKTCELCGLFGGGGGEGGDISHIHLDGRFFQHHTGNQCFLHV